jgi:hypothetical protein
MDRLLSTAVQGRLLSVYWYLKGRLPVEACLEVHKKVVSQRGREGTPVLEVRDSYDYSSEYRCW